MADAAIETAPNDENDDNWLYGESASEVIQEGEAETSEKPQEPPDPANEAEETEDKEDENEEGNEDSQFNDEHFQDVDREDQDAANGDADSQDNGDSDSDDSDHVKVTIGEIKSGPQTYASLNVKRGVGLVTAGSTDKPRQGPATSGKVNLEDLEGPGSINGVPALEFNIDTIEDKPWNKPGADISDYFNYGFNEVTWSAYCERQRRMRVGEAGVALHAAARAPPPDTRRPPVHVRNDDGIPPAMPNNYQARENTIQVMTAERREYGRATHPRDAAEYFAPPEHFYAPHAPHPPYDEPWGQPRHPEQGGWAPSEIKELTPGPPPMGPPMLPPPHLAHAPPHLPPPPYRAHPPPHAPHALDRERERERDRERDRDRMRERDERERREHRRDDEDRDRDRERERSRSIKPERIREKSYRRERSRSRSRRHKSRSRSPRPRERIERDRERSIKPKSKDSKDKDDEK
ncbi:uncharacterized protein Fip1 [Epargyreus clarus]|uniref:uncharacterized protein Fip1 n=1 Tax=Epargyreus clarus TaxID=520877 RepID=UPI003C2D4434